jgi:molybdate transport system regulatory protein
MADVRLFIRLDLTGGERIGPGKIALLEAIGAEGSISAAARRLGMSPGCANRCTDRLEQQINSTFKELALC